MANETSLNIYTRDASGLYYHEQFLTLETLSPLWPGIIFLGLVSNATNVWVFMRAGPGDSVSLLLLSLSVSDGVFLLLITPTASTFLIFHFQPTWTWAVDPAITHTLFYWPAFTFYDFSFYISVFLGVTRCACVAMPLHFKSTFTKRRTAFGIVCLLGLAFFLHLPVLTIFSIGWGKDATTNTSYPVLIASGRQMMVKINDILNRNTLPWIYFITMVACVALLSFKLFQASQVRAQQVSSMTTAGPAISSKPSSPDNKMSSKEIHVVESVVLVCSIFILAQIPSILYSTVRVVNPHFDHDGELVNLFGIFAYVSLTFSLLNATLNIFVYYNYNSRYRSVLRSFFIKQ